MKFIDHIKSILAIFAMIGAISGGLVYLNQFALAADLKNAKAAFNQDLQLAMTKADYAIDKHMEYLLQQINRLEAKPHKTPADLEQLRYLREELERMRKMRRGG